jgi:hypothetical protein
MTTITESRQVRRARERAEAKAKAKQSQLGYIPSKVAGFAPDAGLNSKLGQDNYYWFQTSEFALEMARVSESKQGLRATRATEQDPAMIELSFKCDIMDKDGDKLVMPRPADKDSDCYLLSMKFTREQLHLLADAIDKGGMSVRLTGVPSDIEEIRGIGQADIIRAVMFKDVYSAGNNAGSMVYMGFVDGAMVRSSSDMVADGLRHIADTFEAQVPKFN